MTEKVIACSKCKQLNRLPHTFDRSRAKCGSCHAVLFISDEVGEANANEKMRKPAGFIYVLSSESMPGLVKIGMTSRTVNERVAELNSSSSALGDFVCRHSVMLFNNLEETEKAIHDRLKPYRPNIRREFFKIPHDEAAAVVDEISEPYTITINAQQAERARLERIEESENAKVQCEAIDYLIRCNIASLGDLIKQERNLSNKFDTIILNKHDNTSHDNKVGYEALQFARSCMRHAGETVYKNGSLNYTWYRKKENLRSIQQCSQFFDIDRHLNLKRKLEVMEAEKINLLKAEENRKGKEFLDLCLVFIVIAIFLFLI